MADGGNFFGNDPIPKAVHGKSTFIYKDRRNKAIDINIAILRKMVIQVGWQGAVGQEKKRGYNFKTGVASVAEVATYMEFGAPNNKLPDNKTPAPIPARPTLRPAIDSSRKSILRSQAVIARKAVIGGKFMPPVERLALRLEKQVKKNIRQLKGPPLAPYTVKKRKKVDESDSADPLVFNSQLLNSVTGVVLTAGVPSV